MALRRDLTYPTRYDAATPSQPQGAFKNRSAPAVLDGSYLEEGWLNDWSGFFGKLLGKAGITPNNTIDTALDSQYMDAAENAFYNRVGRNILINGDFGINQRGVAFVPTSIPQYFTSDRWFYSTALGAGVLAGQSVDINQFGIGQTEVANNPRYFLSMQGSVGGGNGLEAVTLQQRIENVYTLQDEMVTLSFWVRGSVVGEVASNMIQFFGENVGASPYTNVNPVNVPVTQDWVKHTYTFLMPSISGKVIDGIDFMNVTIAKQLGATVAAQVGVNPVNYVGELSVADIQVEAGTKATDFERLGIAEQLLICQRYYSSYRIGTWRPMLATGFGIDVLRTTPYRYATVMRVIPSATVLQSNVPQADFDTFTTRLEGNQAVNTSLQTIVIPINNSSFDVRPYVVSGFANGSIYAVRATALIDIRFEAEI